MMCLEVFLFFVYNLVGYSFNVIFGCFFKIFDCVMIYCILNIFVDMGFLIKIFFVLGSFYYVFY